MKGRRPKILLNAIFITFMFVSLLTTTLAGATITVPDDYSIIQMAINVANPGDTVYVRAGTYYENITIGKSLTLQGEDRETTIIDGGGTGNVIYVTAHNVTISGLKIINGLNGIFLPIHGYISHLTVRDAIIDSNEDYGINEMHTGGYWLIEDCIISNNGSYGLGRAHQFHYSTIRDCEVFGNGGTGLMFGWGNGTLIANNKVHHNGGGIHFDSMSYSVAEKNLVYSNGGGICFGYVCYRNTFRENIIYHNNGVGLIDGKYSRYNRIYHNDIVCNDPQVSNRSVYNIDIWDNGYPSGGNYWSDYTGVDLNNDGIGDTPYWVPSGAKDNYPLMRPWNMVQVAVDIKPGSCPNPLNTKSKGVLTVAILGTEDFDPTDIDPTTVLLSREVCEDGISPIRWSYEDVATPFEGTGCDCHDLDGDGYLDLTLKFKTQEVLASLGDVNDGEVIKLTISGHLKKEACSVPIQGSDCIIVLKKGK